MGRLMMDQLRAQTTRNGFAAALDKLPSSLDEMYTQTLDRCTDKAKALRFLSWVLLAKRPLTMSEIRAAFAWRLGATKPLNNGDLEDEESLLSLCMGLVTVSKQTGRVFVNDSYDSWQVRGYKAIVFIRMYTSLCFELWGLTFLIDYTTKEYFSKLVSNFFLTHADITIICLDYIRYHLQIDDVYMEFLIPFLAYSVAHWTDHAIDCPDDEPAKRAALAVLADYQLMNIVNMLQRRSKRVFYLQFASETGLYHLIPNLHNRSPHLLNKVQQGTTPLHLACIHRRKLVVCALLSIKEIDVNVIDIGGRSPLSFAAENGDIHIVRQLLDRGDVQDVHVNVALIFAARAGQVEIVEVFLRYKGVDVKESGTIALHEAARMGVVKVVEVLLKEEMVDINAKTKTSGPSPLLKGVKALERNNYLEEYGYTALHFAASAKCSGVIRLLLAQRDVEVNARSNNGQTPLMIAAQKGRKDSVCVLLEHAEVDVRAEDDERQTALEWAKKGKGGDYDAEHWQWHDCDAVQSLLLDYLERSATQSNSSPRVTPSINLIPHPFHENDNQPIFANDDRDDDEPTAGPSTPIDTNAFIRRRSRMGGKTSDSK
jgi:ankyrin repeat protein